MLGLLQGPIVPGACPIIIMIVLECRYNFRQQLILHRGLSLPLDFVCLISYYRIPHLVFPVRSRMPSSHGTAHECWLELRACSFLLPTTPYHPQQTIDIIHGPFVIFVIEGDVASHEPYMFIGITCCVFIGVLTVI